MEIPQEPQSKPPSTYRELLFSLKDDVLYSCSMIASLVANREQHRLVHQRVRKACNDIVRRHLLQELGDDVIVWEGKLVPAWEGRHWKDVLAEEGLNHKLPVPRLVKPRVTRRMKYDVLIHQLEPFVMYTPETVVDQALERNQFPFMKPSDSLENVRFKAVNSLHQFRKRRMTAHADGAVKCEMRRHNNGWSFGWYGYRWQLALPDYSLSQESKQALRHRVRAWKKGLGEGETEPDTAVRVGQHLPVGIALLMGALVAVMFVSIIWLWQREALERQLADERRVMFERWFPPVYVTTESWELTALLVDLERRYGVPFDTDDTLASFSVLPRARLPWQQVLAEHGLTWQVTSHGHIRVVRGTD